MAGPRIMSLMLVIVTAMFAIAIVIFHYLRAICSRGRLQQICRIETEQGLFSSITNTATSHEQTRSSAFRRLRHASAPVPTSPDGHDSFRGFSGIQVAALQRNSLRSSLTRRAVSSTSSGSAPSESSRASQRLLPAIDPHADCTIVHNFPKSGQGTVKIMQCNQTSKLIVIKTVDMERRKRSRRPALADELTSTASMSLEYCSGGDVDALINHWNSIDQLREQGFPKIFVLYFISSMFAAVGYLHEGNFTVDTASTPRLCNKPMIHRDIKRPNIYLRISDDNQHGLPDVVLGDFGLSCYEQDSEGVSGTPGYLSPESLAVYNLKYTDRHAYRRASTSRIQTRANDVYNFGTALYEVLTLEQFDNRKHTYTPLDLEIALNKTRSTDMQPILDILKLCLVEDPVKRATTKALLLIKPSLNEALELLYKDPKEHMPPDSWPVRRFDPRIGISTNGPASKVQSPAAS
ncbi:hypothetical protein LTR78_006572 [Recurvomyces mirabilis]|uniref:non-specific serine/threonine protein kinase n=1 Tax=Recurvomyces mirabilis TaxID=574656 RepID=A0AAE0WL05_9PEZI|nr:hypothetical protein LTR78_006572 [Recurvomyces mirabilis]KAK5151011.1 hypothetical protein LTS14_009506 [Recurvomyces mirabilis]